MALHRSLTKEEHQQTIGLVEKHVLISCKVDLIIFFFLICRSEKFKSSGNY